MDSQIRKVIKVNMDGATADVQWPIEKLTKRCPIDKKQINQ